MMYSINSLSKLGSWDLILCSCGLKEGNKASIAWGSTEVLGIEHEARRCVLTGVLERLSGGANGNN